MLMLEKRVFLILFILYVGLASAQENIISLMKKYEETSDLSEKTKRETLGHIYVLTRKDLDIMKARTLKDILRSIPMFHYFPNRFGVYTLLNPGERAGIAIKYRLFIDNQEVSSIHTSNPFLAYDHYPLDHINHVEIYYSLGAISVSSEPSQLIIKLYTKEPERENSSSVRGAYSQKSDYAGSLLITRNISNKESFLFLVNQSFYNYKTVSLPNGNIYRDTLVRNFFFKYRYKNLLLETGYTSSDRDIFTGFSLNSVPDKGGIKTQDFYINFASHWLADNSLKFVISYDVQNRDYYELNREGLFYPLQVFNPDNPVVEYNDCRKFERYSFNLEKRFNKGRNSFLTGVSFIYNRQTINRINYRLADNTVSDSYNEEKFSKIISLYVEEIFQLERNVSIIGGLKVDRYKFYTMKSKTDYILRIGVASVLGNSVYLKGFLSRSYLLPSFFLLENAYENKLEPITVYVFSSELGYQINSKHKISLLVQDYLAKNHYDFDKNKKRFINGNSKRYKVLSFLYRFEPNLFNSIEVNYWLTNQGDTVFSPNKGGYIKIFTEYKSFKIYNELVYKSSYKPLFYNFGDSIDYSISVSYDFFDGWTVIFKGQNLFDRSAKVVRAFPYGTPSSYGSYDRTIWLGISKTF